MGSPAALHQHAQEDEHVPKTALPQQGAVWRQVLCPQGRPLSHTHEYRFWHAHVHKHLGVEHDTGHYHLYVQNHDHGDGNKSPHSHKEKQAHPAEDGVTVHHHGLADHEK